MHLALDQFYLNREEPLKSFFFALRTIILNYDDQIDERLKYGLAFFYYRNKPFCYLWKDKKTNQPYIGITKGNLIDHPALFQGDRKKMKVIPMMLEEDIPKDIIYTIFDLATKQY